MENNNINQNEISAEQSIINAYDCNAGITDYIRNSKQTLYFMSNKIKAQGKEIEDLKAKLKDKDVVVNDKPTTDKFDKVD